ncbi:MAG: formylmethanofuran dehydrogenase subunit C [Planctomycetaceae bacterium]
MSELYLELTAIPDRRVDASPLTPCRLAGMNDDAVRRVPLTFENGKTTTVGELFRVDGAASEALFLNGNLAMFDRVGAGMSRGVVTVDLSVGDNAGRDMTGGTLEIRGDAADGTGIDMSGGTIVVRGSAGRRSGSASPGAKRGMSGGEIVVFGDAGSETGASLRRGVIAVAGRIGPDAARAAIAGTVLAGQGFDPPAGRWLKRASLVSLGETTIPPAFLATCTYRPSFVAVLLTHLRRTYGFPVTAKQASGLYRQFRGDMAESGRGEILLWTGG